MHIFEKNIEDMKVKEMQQLLQTIGCYHSLKNKSEYVTRLRNYEKVTKFPWRKEQKEVIDSFLKFDKTRYIIQGIFGAGKSTMLLGMVILGLLKNLFKPTDVMFISFNVSIKNEMKRKLKSYGLSSKIEVRTFDSIVYEIAKMGKYPHIDLPNFEGKRKFVYELIFNKEFNLKPTFQPKIMLVDECQDLEKIVLDILEHYYPETKFVFAGDIFQSVIREARESLLWYYMMLSENENIYKIYMTDTPRVPIDNLNTLKTALSIHYPEFKDKIAKWTSSNVESKADVEWRRFNSYSHIHDELKMFLGEHGPEETMIITFSSAITVKGAMGDIARLRRFLNESGFKVNSDHKKQEPENYFLSTAHSSKGLERDYVIIFLTFPLERAFVHLSDDVVVNLLTVALTRAKKKVFMYVPTYTDKFTRCLGLFENCPAPNKDRIRDSKVLKEFKFQDYFDVEHCPTEIIRASVIKYDTRIKLREYTKQFSFSKVFDSDIGHKFIPIATEEERCFVGVFIENLITSTWISRWPDPHFHDVKNHPFYTHIIKRITKAEGKYLEFTRSNLFDEKKQFDGMYLYSQLHVALSNKLFINLSENLINSLKSYWHKLKPKAILMKPYSESGKLKIQSRIRMPWVAGVADATTEDSDGKTMSIYEIKASQDRNWVENALIQIIMYALMNGKTWYRLHLINPFQNQKISYYFDTKQILSLRKELLKDVIVYNLNSFMAKTYPDSKNNKKLDVSKTMFLNIVRDKNGSITQASILNMISPIKCEFIYSKYASSDEDKTNKMSKQEKFACESVVSSKELEDEIKSILKSGMNKDKVIWSFDNHNDIIYTNSIKNFYELNKIEDIFSYLEYNKNPDLMYSADLNDSLFQNLFCLAYMFKKNYFV